MRSVQGQVLHRGIVLVTPVVGEHIRRWNAYLRPHTLSLLSAADSLRPPRSPNRYSSSVAANNQMTSFDLLAFLLASEPGGADSSFGIASLRPRTRSGGVRGLVLKKFMWWDDCRIGKVDKCAPQTLCRTVGKPRRNFKTCLQTLGCESKPEAPARSRLRPSNS